MDQKLEQRGLASLHWFLVTHAREVPADLLQGLLGNDATEEPDLKHLLHRIADLQAHAVDRLRSLLEGHSEEYFGTKNGTDLSLFVHNLSRKTDCVLPDDGSRPINPFV